MKNNYPKIRKKREPIGVMQCTVCGKDTPRNSVKQLYCPDCSDERAKLRGQKWSNANGKRKYDAKRTQYADTGEALSTADRLTLESSAPAMPSMAWYARVGIPFSWAGSKNHIFATTQRGHVFMRDESRYMRSLLTSEIYEATKTMPVVQNKLWIDIFAQKPRANGDAVNFVDMVCDAIKDGLPLDDRWYSIRSVDWQITKVDPMLFVGVGQEATENVQACSSCGRLLTFDYFQRNRGLKHGIGRNCRDCMLVKRESKKRDNARLAMAIEHHVGVFE